MISLLTLPLLGGILIAALAGPLGSLVLWRRMAFFGETIAHSVFLGMALSLFFALDTKWGILFIGLLFALLLAAPFRRHHYHGDTILSIFSHGSFGLGMVLITLLAPRSFSLFEVFFGDILAINSDDILWITLAGLGSLILLKLLWRPLLNITINEDMARVDQEPIFLVKFCFMAIVALFVALSLKIVGALLTTALLVTPAATIRPFVQSPQAMALGASLLGVAALVSGLILSVFLDLPTGPLIVTLLLGLFLLAQIPTRFFR